jgi:hypothetical protein
MNGCVEWNLFPKIGALESAPKTDIGCLHVISITSKFEHYRIHSFFFI